MADLTGATSSSYTPAGSDYNRYLRVAVDASLTGYNTQTAFSLAGKVAAATMTNTGLPGSPSGTAKVGGSITESSTGSWSATPDSYAYQWQSGAAATGPWTLLAAATGQSYTATTGDFGRFLSVQVTAVKLGAIDYLPKPADVNMVLRMVRKAATTDDKYILVVDDDDDFKLLLSRIEEMRGPREFFSRG